MVVVVGVWKVRLLWFRVIISPLLLSRTPSLPEYSGFHLPCYIRISTSLVIPCPSHLHRWLSSSTTLSSPGSPTGECGRFCEVAASHLSSWMLRISSLPTNSRPAPIYLGHQRLTGGEPQHPSPRAGLGRGPGSGKQLQHTFQGPHWALVLRSLWLFLLASARWFYLLVA